MKDQSLKSAKKTLMVTDLSSNKTKRLLSRLRCLERKECITHSLVLSQDTLKSHPR